MTLNPDQATDNEVFGRELAQLIDQTLADHLNKDECRSMIIGAALAHTLYLCTKLLTREETKGLVTNAIDCIYDDHEDDI